MIWGVEDFEAMTSPGIMEESQPGSRENWKFREDPKRRLASLECRNFGGRKFQQNRLFGILEAENSNRIAFSEFWRSKIPVTEAEFWRLKIPTEAEF